jgi:hypothetical protein
VLTGSLARARRARGSRVGRLELHNAGLRRPRSGGTRPSDLRNRRTFGDRSCPLLSAVYRSAADLARTDEGLRSRPVADAFGALVLHDQGPIGRPAR